MGMLTIVTLRSQVVKTENKNKIKIKKKSSEDITVNETRDSEYFSPCQDMSCFIHTHNLAVSGELKAAGHVYK